MPKATDVLANFYPEFYRSKYPDVANDSHYGASLQRAFQHYVDHGMKEMRQPNPFFDPKYYLKIHKDLSNLNFDGVQLFDHWLRYGIKEGRRATDSFHVKWYVDSYQDLSKAFGQNYEAGFQHWIEYGNAERRLTAPDSIMRLFAVNNGQETKLVAANASKEDEIWFEKLTKSDDPDMLNPFNTTGGQIGFGTGIIVGTYTGGIQGALGGGVAGAIIGHGLDRIITRVSNDITGPAWKELENGIIGKSLGDLGGGISKAWKKAIGI